MTISISNPKNPDGGAPIQVDIDQTRFGPAADDSAYTWSGKRQWRFDEEYVDSITPESVKFRTKNPKRPVSQEK